MKNNRKRLVILLLVLCIAVLAAAIVIREINSGKNDPVIADTGITSLGEGETAFVLSVVDGEQQEQLFEIHTDETMLGAALQKLNLLEGDEGPYGLYVTAVNGVTARYEEDGSWWCLYTCEADTGEYVMAVTGVDTTELTEGCMYRLKVEK